MGLIFFLRGAGGYYSLQVGRTVMYYKMALPNCLVIPKALETVSKTIILTDYSYGTFAVVVLSCTHQADQ